MGRFLPFQLGNSDVILGVQWLEKLGTVITNWKLQTMKFQVNGKTVTLKGDPSLTRSKISLKAMIKTIRKEGGGILVELNRVEAVEGVERFKPGGRFLKYSIRFSHDIKEFLRCRNLYQTWQGGQNGELIFKDKLGIEEVKWQK